MLAKIRVYLSSGLIAVLFSCFAHMAYGYGMECEKPTLVSSAGVNTSFSFECKNTTGVHFASYKIFPVCNNDSSPAGVCDSVVFTATGCPYSIAPGAVCEVQANFMPMKTGVYSLDFNDEYGSVRYYDIFCNDPTKGCISADATPFAYVVPSGGANLIDKCPMNATSGEFASCSTAYDNNQQSYTKLTFAIVSDIQYAYVTDQNNGLVYQCTINTDGNLNECISTAQNCNLNNSQPPCGGWSPYAITFATVNNQQYAYVTEVGSDYIYQCFLDTNGLFTSCSQGPSFAAPYGIDFATVGGQQYAYIANAGPGGACSTGQVQQCTVNNDGSLSSCTIAISPQGPNLPSPPCANSDPAWIPYGIQLATFAGVQYAYVADNGTTASNGGVYKCSLNTNDGLFTSCSLQNAPTNNWSPVEIAFAMLDGTQYAYVPSNQSGSGNMFWCTLNNNGSFNVCNATPNSPPTPWAPTGLAFRFN